MTLEPTSHFGRVTLGSTWTETPSKYSGAFIPSFIHTIARVVSDARPLPHDVPSLMGNQTQTLSKGASKQACNYTVGGYLTCGRKGEGAVGGPRSEEGADTAQVEEEGHSWLSSSLKAVRWET